jgi:hypothetical protein
VRGNERSVRQGGSNVRGNEWSVGQGGSNVRGNEWSVGLGSSKVRGNERVWGKAARSPSPLIPAKAGIQRLLVTLASRLL